MTLLVENVTTEDIEIGDLGITISGNNGTYDIDTKPLMDRYNSKDATVYLNNSDLVIRDNGGTPYPPNQAIALFRGSVNIINNVDTITRYTFWARFTLAEKVAIETSVVPEVKVVKDSLLMAEYINLNHPDLGPSLDILVDNGIITTTRKDEIMTI